MLFGTIFLLATSAFAAPLPTARMDDASISASKRDKRGQSAKILPFDPSQADRLIYWQCPMEVASCRTPKALQKSVNIECKAVSQKGKLFFKTSGNSDAANDGQYVRGQDVEGGPAAVDAMKNNAPDCLVGMVWKEIGGPGTRHPQEIKSKPAPPGQCVPFEFGPDGTSRVRYPGPNDKNLHQASFCVPHSDQECFSRAGDNISGNQLHDVEYSESAKFVRCW